MFKSSTAKTEESRKSLPICRSPYSLHFVSSISLGDKVPLPRGDNVVVSSVRIMSVKCFVEMLVFVVELDVVTESRYVVAIHAYKPPDISRNQKKIR